jgi:DNA-binding NarL/FixJ family response regulator
LPRLLIADDHELARSGLRNVLTTESDLEVVGEAGSGREAVALCHKLRPDLVLMDVRMPDMDGLTATQAIKQQLPRTSVLMVTMHEKPSYLLEALKAGAAGYILKDASEDELLAAVRQILAGESLLNPELATKALRELAGEATGGAAVPEQLTPREREVVQLLALGRTNAQIAEELTVSVNTVKVHVEHVIQKLGVSDRTQAAVRAVELGLVTSADPATEP